MRDKLVEFQEETGHNFDLESTPAEGTCFSLALKDKKRFSDIIVANEEEYRKGANPYYTNSTNLHVSYTDDIFTALDHQNHLQPLYTGGTVNHLFLGQQVEDIEALKKLIKMACSKYKIPYFSITPTFSICPSHGYLTGKVEHCPECNSKCEIWSRITGYLRPVVSWNLGKKAEFNNRKPYTL